MTLMDKIGSLETSSKSSPGSRRASTLAVSLEFLTFFTLTILSLAWSSIASLSITPWSAMLFAIVMLLMALVAKEVLEQNKEFLESAATIVVVPRVEIVTELNVVVAC